MALAILSHLLLILLTLSTTGFYAVEPAEDYTGLYCNPNSQKPDNQTSSNTAKVLSVLVPAASRDGFATASSGESQSRVYGLAQCRGDVSPKDCSSCIRQASLDIRTRCPDRVDARIWYEYCFMRYNTEDFIGDVDAGSGTLYANVENVTEPEKFNKALGKLEKDVAKQATAPENKGLGKGKRQLSEFVTLYALVQCTRDLSQVNCAQCLAIAVEKNFAAGGFCNNKKGCRVLYSSCYVRYELYPFYFPLDRTGINNTAVAGGAESRNNYFSTTVNYKA
ncbi:unnamed protein product [Cuscuta campestris]|uniref:Gnk2-homologous domain-containing protein n=1 Tax=Cuscuta campestris TaxID=132261 RepID=A0A484NI48_9ASTE|nr:unnamed protein product [Cuscuta campestris]